MPRARFIASLLAVALLVAGCGGGEEDASEEPEGTRADGMSEVTRDDDDQPDTVRDSAEQTDQPDASAEPEPLPVRLGDRFPVCADVQAKWDALDISLAALREAEAQVQNTNDAAIAATDELDRAEAKDELREAQRTLSAAQDRFDSAKWQAVHNGLSLGHRLHLSGNDDPRSVAYARAWAAFVDSADPATVAAVTALESALTAYDIAKAAADAVVAQARANEDAAQAAAEEALQAYGAARHAIDRAKEVDSTLADAITEAWDEAEAVAEAARSSRDRDTLNALLAYDTAYTEMLAAGERWSDAYNTDAGHEALAAAQSEHSTAQEEAIAALAEIDAAASETIREALANYRAVGPTYLEAHTAWKVGRVAVDAAEEQAKAIRAANAEIYRDAHVDISPVDYADDALTAALNGEVLGGAGYSAFRDSFRESCQ